jgi:serine/threonine-protein kinase
MIGRVFLGRYEAQKLLGEGGMGKVYLARQLDLGRQVVVKVMHDHVAADPKFRDRFRRETVLMARFQHPNAVTLYDASLNDPNGPCIVMEYVKGENLEKLLQKNGRLAPARAARVVHQLCDVLQAAHDEGMIHRDLKPANLMITDPDTPKERVKVMDFGLAKLIEDGNADRRVTDTTVDFAVGTPGYICPEQVRGEAMDHRGDLYSVGVMLYELLTGRLPFVGATSMDVLLAHATEDPPKFVDLGVRVPRAVEEVVRWCLAKDPGDRPQSARELAARYAAAVERTAGGPPAPHPVGAAARTAGADGDLVTLSAEATPATKSDIQLPEGSPATPRPGTLAALPDDRPATATDSASLPFHVEAWMPESIAVMKLRGFVRDSGGEVVESVPGLIRVRLTKASKSGAFSWLGFTRRADGPIDMELHLHRLDPGKEKLAIHILFRPSHPMLLGDEGWRKRCSGLFVQLRAYLMGGV